MASPKTSIVTSKRSFLLQTVAHHLLWSMTVNWRFCRHLPSKKSVVVAFGIFGSSFAAVMQSLFGRWIPSYHQLIYSPVCPPI